MCCLEKVLYLGKPQDRTFRKLSLTRRYTKGKPEERELLLKLLCVWVAGVLQLALLSETLRERISAFSQL